MKIALINVVYNTGSTGHIVKTIFDKLTSDGNDVSVIHGRGNKIDDKNIYKKTLELESKFHHFISKLSGNMYGGMHISTHRIIRKLKKLNPEVVNIHCINGYFVNIYFLLTWLAKNNVKTVLTMHADFMMTGGCGYSVDCVNYLTKECKNCQYFKSFNGRFSLNAAHRNYLKMKKAIQTFSKNKLKVTCVSPWLTKRYKESAIYKDFSIETILNPVSEVFLENCNDNPYSTNNNILYVTPDINDIEKSGWLIRDIAAKRPDLNFTVICTKQTHFSFENKNINFISGGLPQEKLKDYYYFADGIILLSKRETFSMVVAESLVCGTPVYGFKSGGPETICIDDYCSFVEYGNIDLLSKNLLSISKKKDVIANEAKHKYSSDEIVKSYLEVYKF